MRADSDQRAIGELTLTRIYGSWRLEEGAAQSPFSSASIRSFHWPALFTILMSLFSTLVLSYLDFKKSLKERSASCCDNR